MIYDNEGPIYSVLTSKNPCGAYGGVELDGSTSNGVVLNATNCNAGLLGSYCRGGVVSGWCCFGPCADSSDCPSGSCSGGQCCATSNCGYCRYTLTTIVTDPADCPGDSYAEHVPAPVDQWYCIKLTGPFTDLTSEQWSSAGENFINSRCPALANYDAPQPVSYNRCTVAGGSTSECCDPSEICNVGFGCAPRS